MSLEVILAPLTSPEENTARLKLAGNLWDPEKTSQAIPRPQPMEIMK